MVEARSYSRISGATSCDVVTEIFGCRFGDELRRLGLVAGIGVRVQEDDGDGRHAAVHQPARLRRHGARVELARHRAVGAHTLGDLQPPVAGHERLRLGDVQVVQLELSLAADLQRVGEACGGEQPGDRAPALDERVGEQRGGVDDPGEVARRQAVLTQEPLDARGDGPGRVVVGGQDLAVELPAAGLVVDDDVGEGAADVDSERVAHGVSTLEPAADQVKRPARPCRC